MTDFVREGNSIEAQPAVEEQARVEEAPLRGGMSLGAVLTGMMVSLGTLAVAAVPATAIAIWTNFNISTLTRNESMRFGIAAGVAFAAVAFLASMWGGYAAGRMSRGAGARNGLLVPIMLMLMTSVIATVTGALGGLTSPVTVEDLAISRTTLVNLATWIAIAAGIAMVAGGLLGGFLGSRWHTKLERRVVQERRARRPLVHRRSHRRAITA
jgi:hypothetical protein